MGPYEAALYRLCLLRWPNLELTIRMLVVGTGKGQAGITLRKSKLERRGPPRPVNFAVHLVRT